MSRDNLVEYDLTYGLRGGGGGCLNEKYVWNVYHVSYIYDVIRVAWYFSFIILIHVSLYAYLYIKLAFPLPGPFPLL